jgi:vacuolar-type H+-ATPase subunit I/STV1
LLHENKQTFAKQVKSDVDLEFLRKNIFSSKSSTSETDENELLAARLQREEKFRQELEAELQRQKAESSKAADLASKQRIEIERQNAEIQKLKERLTLSQSNHETDRRRLEDETRVADRLKETNAQLTQDLETERNRFNEVRNDLQVAIDSISARGPYINMDMPLNDLETRILHNIRLNT